MIFPIQLCLHVFHFKLFHAFEMNSQSLMKNWNSTKWWNDDITKWWKRNRIEANLNEIIKTRSMIEIKLCRFRDPYKSSQILNSLKIRWIDDCCEYSTRGSEHWAVGSGHWAIGSEHRLLTIEHWALTTDHRPLRIRNRELRIENRELRTQHRQLRTAESPIRVDHQQLNIENSPFTT
jgi:hypothetical protein